MAIRQKHIEQLRVAVDAMSVAATLGTISVTDIDLTGVEIKAQHITELRTQLDAARVKIGLPSISYVDAVLASGMFLEKEHTASICAPARSDEKHTHDLSRCRVESIDDERQ